MRTYQRVRVSPVLFRTTLILGIVTVCSFTTIFAVTAQAWGFGRGDHRDNTVTICHYTPAHGGSWDVLQVHEQGWNGHSEHQKDFLVTEDTPCPPEEHERHDRDHGDRWHGGDEHGWGDDDQDENDDECTDEEETEHGDDDDSQNDEEEQDNDNSVIDMCTNLDDLQTVVPEGYTEAEHICTSITPSDDEQEEGTDETTPPAVVSHGGGGACMNCGDHTEDVTPIPHEDEAGTVETTDDSADTQEGEVLGASCVPLLTSYLREGHANNIGEVAKLQLFLNKHQNGTVPVTGIFDHATTELVNEFQLRYRDEVLLPWVTFGHASKDIPTGYVYKTTLWKINALACPASATGAPILP